MAFYESTFITRQDLSRQDVNKLAESLGSIVEQGGGKVMKNEYWGLKSLSYRIQKNRKGHYTMLALDASPEAIKEMERNMRINEDIIRALTVRLDEMPEGPSVMMQQARGRDEGYTPDTGEVASEPVVTVAAEQTQN
jgi:small subunit ribosomal protein S6